MTTKKIILCFALLSAIVAPLTAARKHAQAKFRRTSSSGIGSVHHRPINMPIDVYTDSDTHTIEVCCDDPTIEGEVYLYDSTGNVENYSPVINTVFPVSTPGEYSISIQGDIWSGEAQIFID